MWWRVRVVNMEVTEVVVACACGKYRGDRGCGGVCMWQVER